MLSIYDKYEPNANPANTNYPNGSGKDESVSGANDGTPLEMDWYNDMLGFSEALLGEGRLTPSGDADTALVSDRLDAFRLAALRVQTACDFTDGDISLVDVIYVGLDITSVDYVIDRNSLTRWSVGSATGAVTADNLNTSTGVVSGVSGALTQVLLGTAASADLTTSKTATSGVLQAGDGGLNSTASSSNNIVGADLDTVKTSGLYYSASTINGPAGVGNGYLFVEVSSSSLYVKQTYMGALEASTYVFTRRLVNGTWEDWDRNFSKKTSATSTQINTGTSTDTVVTPSGLAGSSFVEQKMNASGSAPMYACRAWVNFDGVGTPSINAQGNVTSVTENATGDWTITFTTAMPDSNYAISGMSANSSGNNQNIQLHSSTQGGAPTLKTTTQVRIVYNGGGGFIAGDNISLMIVR